MDELLRSTVKWPTIPTLKSNVDFFFNDGIILYGGMRGPLKIEGKNSEKIIMYVLNELRNNELNSFEFLKKISKLYNKESIFYILEKLNSTGFIIDKNAKTPEEKYLDELNQFEKNYLDFEEILEYKSNIRIKISINNIDIKEQLTKLLLKYDFIITESNNYDWRIYEIDASSNLKDIDEAKRNFIFSTVENGTIIGPIVASDAVKVSNLNFFKKLVYESKSSKEVIYSIFLTITKTILKLKNLKLDKGLVFYQNFNSKYIDLIEIIGENHLSILEKYQIRSSLSAPRYVSEYNYKSKYENNDTKFKKIEFASKFWKEIKYSCPRGLEEIFGYLVESKEETSSKTINLPEGNINSNILFYINLDHQDLHGEGIYFYECVTNKLYQVDNKIDKLRNAIEINHMAQGYLVLGSSIETIYSDITFKIANIKTGVQLATLLLSTDVFKDSKQVLFLSNYDEQALKDIMGVSMNKILFNTVLEVIK